MKGFTPTA